MNENQIISKFGSAQGIRRKFFRRLFYSLFFLVATYFPAAAAAQKIAFLTPDKSTTDQFVREKFETMLSAKFKILDDSIIESVPAQATGENIFNLSTDEARNYGQALGCDFFVLVKAETLRRSTETKAGFYIESYAAVYLVSARTGRLAFWKLESFESPTAAESEKKLTATLESLAREMSEKIISTGENERQANPSSALEELPEENSPAAKNFRSPLPYRRFKPEYTPLASSYGVTATVDATVDLDEQGNIQRVEITRWAGYGLDEAVAATIRKMQWRAAERDGKSLPIRVLLRYNFKKPDHDEK